MIDLPETLDLDRIHEMVDQINAEMNQIRSNQNLMVLPSEQPRDPDNGQMWAAGGKIFVFTSNGIETYSKD